MSELVVSVGEPVTSVSVVEDVVSVSVVESPVVVGVQVSGLQGVKGDTGATGATGSQGPSGVVSVTAPITNTGTSTSAVIGVDQSQFVVAQSQVTGLVSALAAKANLAGGNTFTGAQIINTGAVGTIGLQVNTPASPTNHMQVWSLNGSYRSVVDKNGFLSVGGSTALGNITSYAFGASQIPLVLRGAASQTANLQEWQNSAGTILGRITAGGGLSFTGNGASNYAEFTGDVSTAGSIRIGSTTFTLSGSKILGMANATAPTANATGGGYLYAEGGALKWRGSSGTITTIAAA
jgi:hypothetical protein